MRRLRIICLVVCLAMFLVSSALLISNARGNVQVSNDASLSLTYGHSGTYFKDLEVKIYRVAGMVGNTTFVPEGDFYGIPVELNKIRTQSEWNEVASTLAGYVVSEELVPTKTATTDENGKVYFQDLTTGLYFVEMITVELEDGFCRFDNFVITLPGVDDEDEWIYDVEAIPKSSFHEYENKEIEYTISKLWKDDGNRDKRPQSVEIELYCDGVYSSSIALSGYNNWTYTWKSDENVVWTAVEKNVAEGYTVTVDRNGTHFSVVNTYDDPPPPPQTGDYSTIYLTVAIISMVGVLFLATGFVKAKGKAA